MGPGTLYGSLRRMGDQGLIAETSRRKDDTVHRERRRYYALTNFGHRVVRLETRRLSEVVAFACSKVQLGEPEVVTS